MAKQERSSGKRELRTDRRDLIAVAAICIAVFSMGAWFGIFDAIARWITATIPLSPADLDALLVVALGGAGTLAVIRWRQSGRDRRLRAVAEESYRLLVEQVPAITYSWDPTMPTGTQKPLFVSPQVEQILGYTPEEWMTSEHFWIDRIHPDDRDRVVTASDASDRLGTPFDLEYRMLAKNGDVVWLRDESSVILDSEGRPERAQGIMHDITRGRMDLLDIESAERRYRELLEHLPVVAYTVDAGTEPATETRDRWIGPGIEGLTGYSRREWMSEPDIWKRLTHPDDRETVETAWEPARRGGRPFSLEYRTVHKDGHIVWVRDQAHILPRAEPGRPSVWQGVLEDITARKGAEEQLRTAEERYRTLVEQLPAVVYIDAVDELSTALYISPRYQRMFGFTAQERMDDPGLWIRQLHPDDRERVIVESERTNRTGDPFDIEYRWIRRDGATIWVHDQASQVEGPGGVRAWQGVLTDITERKLAQDTLARRDLVLQAAGLAAERFLRAASWSDCIDEVLARVGEAGGASRAFVFRNDRLEDGRLAMTRIFEWNAPGIEAVLNEPYNTAYPYEDGYSDWEVILPKGTAVQGLRTKLEPRQREWMEREGIHSSLAVPVFVGGAWWGFIGLDQCVEEREWQPAEVEALRVVASTLGAAIGRVHAADLLTETENRYRALIEQLPTATYIVSVQAPHRTLYMSPQIETILGYPPIEWTSDFWERSLHPEDAERVLAEDARADATGDLYSIEYRLRARDGRWVWVHDQAQRVLDAAGKPIYWQGVRADITERKNAEHLLREAEERFRRLVEQMPAITYVDDFDPNYEDVWPTSYISPQVQAVLGHSADEWRVDPYLWTKLTHPEDRDRVNAANDHHYESEEPLDLELRMVHKDGSVRWLRDEAVIIRGEDGLSRQSQGILQDITERKVAEEHLREAEERYRAIVEHVPAIIYVDAADDSMRTTYISPHVYDLTGYTPQEWLDDPQLWLRSVHVDDREMIAPTYREALASHAPWGADYRMVTREGRTIWVHDEMTTIRDETGAPLFLQGVIFDVTERKLAEQALRDSEQRERDAAERLRALDEMKNTFLAAVSHELRSPLTSILGLSLTLERTREMPEADRNDLLERLSANARKLDRLLKDLLDIDRLNRGIVEPQYQVIDVGSLARRVIDNLDVLSDRLVQVHAASVEMAVDPAKVERIIENLVVNAVRHTGGDRTIWLKVDEDLGGVLITVEDDGPGVPESLRDAIFEPFRQGPTVSPHSPGTGIGLSLVARFAELHGGRAWVEDRPGGGASFKVYLPGQSSFPAPALANGHANGHPRGGADPTGHETPASRG